MTSAKIMEFWIPSPLLSVRDLRNLPFVRFEPTLFPEQTSFVHCPLTENPYRKCDRKPFKKAMMLITRHNLVLDFLSLRLQPYRNKSAKLTRPNQRRDFRRLQRLDRGHSNVIASVGRVPQLPLLLHQESIILWHSQNLTDAGFANNFLLTYVLTC